MKRLVMTFTALTGFILFTACESTGNSSAKAEQKLSGSFSADMILELDDFTAEGTLTRLDSGIWNVYFASPSEIAGINLDFSGDKTEASYKGLSFSVPQAAMPSKALLTDFIKAVDSIAESEDITGNKKDDLIELEGEFEGEKYILYLNGDGSLAEFRMDNMGGSITFDNFSSNVKVTTTATTIESLVVTTTDTMQSESNQ